jgi:hypothetical protein
VFQASGLGYIFTSPELWKAGDEPLGFRKLEMIQASGGGYIFFILLNFEKLEMHLHALES